jgi:hypothetical protein
MTKFQYEHMKNRNQFNVLRRACKNTPALIAYENLPERFKKQIKEILGCNPYDAVKISQVEIHIQDNAEISNFFEEYRLPDGRHLPREIRKEYYANAIVLEGIHHMLTDKRPKIRARGGRMRNNWKEIAEGVQELDRTKYPHNLPDNSRRLEDKFKKYFKEGPESLIHKNFLNVNAAKIDDEIKESYLTELLASQKNLDNAQVARLYNMIAEQMGWKKITSSAVAKWRDKLNLTIYAGRRGTVEFYNKKAMQVKRKAPAYPLLYWTLDGWDVELLYQTTEKGTTTYHNRPTVVVVLDACVKYPIGYAIGTHETPELTKTALRNAALHTAKLFGKMYRAHQIQSDRYAIKKLTPYYATIAEKVTPARAKNAKAKIIEPYFSQLNKKWCQLLPNWSGFGITSDKEKQPNVEYLNKIKNTFPDYEGVVKQVEMIMERERAEKIDRYMELWNEMDETLKIELSYESYLLKFGETTGRTVLMQGTGLHPTILGQRRDYDCFEIGFRDHASVKWQVMYDPDNLEKVLAVNEDQSLQFLLEKKYIQPMALAERKEGDSEELQRVREFNGKLTEEVTNRRAKAGTIVSNHFGEHNEIAEETLKKLLITDSNGQHKNEKNKARTGSLLPPIAEAVIITEEDDDEINLFDKY